MSNKKTLYISDLDGTLLNDSAELSEKSRQLLNCATENGTMFTAATARTLASARVILKGLTLKIPIILMNGVLIYDFNAEEYIFKAVLGTDTVKKIISALRECAADAFMYTIEKNSMHTYYERLSGQVMLDFYNERRVKYYKSFTQTEDFLSLDGKNIIYFTVIAPYERLAPLYKRVSEIDDIEISFYSDHYSKEIWYIEIFSAEASKRKAVQYLRKLIMPERIVCFGDNLNDLPMFEEADKSIAVKNAVSQVRARADEIIGANTENSVAQYIYSRSAAVCTDK
ncbi:Cof-type HAD-IIB family hydrolase [Hominimerdicola sp. 21CYCFAH17_S]